MQRIGPKKSIENWKEFLLRHREYRKKRSGKKRPAIPLLHTLTMGDAGQRHERFCLSRKSDSDLLFQTNIVRHIINTLYSAGKKRTEDDSTCSVG
jgi:hypothetical protein